MLTQFDMIYQFIWIYKIYPAYIRHTFRSYLSQNNQCIDIALLVYDKQIIYLNHI